MRQNLKPKRRHDIKSDYGLYDYFKHYKSKGGKLSHNQFRNILMDFNEGLYPIICSFNYDYKLPKRIGIVSVAEHKTYVKFDKDGNLISNKPVDYKATLDLWEENPELYNEGFVVRHDQESTFRITYSKAYATFKNKNLYKFNANRGLKQYLKNVIFNDKNYKAKLWKLSTYH